MSQVTRFPDPLTDQYNPSAWMFVDTDAIGYEPTDNLTATSSSATQNLGGNIITGNLNIGANTSGTIVIGSATSTTTITGALSIIGYAKLGTPNTFNSLQTMTGGLTVTGATQINHTGSENTNIGHSSNTTTVNGNLHTLIIDTTAVDKNLTIGATQVGGQISIGLLSTRTGDINIGNNMAGGVLKLVNNIGVDSTASVQLGTSNRGTNYLRGATVNICNDGGNVNMGVGGSTIHVLGTTNINTEGTAVTIIGNSTGTLVVNGAGIRTNTITTPTTDGILSIGSNQIAGGAITMGSSTSIVKVNGTFKADTIDSTTTATLLSIGGKVGETARTANIDIGVLGFNGVLGAGRGINIGSGVNNPYSFIVSGSSTLGFNIMRGIVVNINVDGGTTNIGSVGFDTSVYGTLKTNLIVPIGGNLILNDTANITTIGSGNGAVNVGTATSVTTVNGTLKSQTYDGISATTELSIGGNMVGGNFAAGLAGSINIGGNLSPPQIVRLGKVTTGIVRVEGRFETNTIRSIQTSDTLVIADDQTTGRVEIGSNTGRFGSIFIGDAMSPGNAMSPVVFDPTDTNFGRVNIVTNANYPGVIVNIGTTGTNVTTTNIKGAVNINTTGSATTTIGNDTGTLVVNGAGIKTNKIIPSTGTTLTLGGDTVTNVDIGSSTSITTINGTTILTGYAKTGANANSYSSLQTMTGGLDVTGTTNITGNGGTVNIGTGVTTTFINIGTSATTFNSYIGLGHNSLPYNYIRAQNLEINTNNGGTTNIGWENLVLSTYGITNLIGNLITRGNSIVNKIRGIGGLISSVFGNSSGDSALSTTFNKKNTTGSASPLADQNCYTIVGRGAYTSQYFEIVVSGSNYTRGGYSYKGCFIIETNATTILQPSVTTLFYICSFEPTAIPPVITFGIVGNTATLKVNTSSVSANQIFVTTLIGYPTVTIYDELYSCVITAI